MSEIDRRLAGALADLAEHYERAMTRQAELGGRLQRQVNDLARDYAALADTLHGR